ncbi:amino acid adenylation domain-containing protein [Pseudoalteromonas sp. T1lg65]|uniref:amino acid adenylation domain-containing protein n=1 Tax=Pseudoalteromonas sp. T1lg65 TaxID=2077101 RepID=UPI003F79A60E
MAATILDLIHQQASQPSKLALVDAKQHIDFCTLLKTSQSIAAELIAQNIPPNSLIAVCMDRSWQLIATLLGVMRAGCAYVPIDPAYPSDRVDYMIKHSGANVAIVDQNNVALLDGKVSKLIHYHHACETQGQVLYEVKPDSLAYVIYTSGSTGQPKGVAVQHSSVYAMSQAMHTLLAEHELQGVLAATSVCFDPSVMEIFGTLALGGVVVIAKNILEYPTLPCIEKVRTCIAVPSAIQTLSNVHQLPDTLKCVVFGGEVLKPALLKQLRAKHKNLRMINVYGPTEDTVFSTAIDVTNHTDAISIGKPVQHTRAYVLDDELRPVTKGQAAQLYLAGSKLAQGYLHDAVLTQSRFVELSPNENVPEERLYKTGDLCRWNDAGELEFLGRVDQQVKVRGYRIELEEVESALEMLPDVDFAAVAVKEVGVGHNLLVAYLVAPDNPNEESIRDALNVRLPAYMVPSVFVFLSELPRLPNGKLARDLLPESHHNTDAKTTIDSENLPVTIASYTEVIQMELASLLNLPLPLSKAIDTPFINLGLDSLTSLELASRLSEKLGLSVSVSTVLKYTTTNKLAAYLLEQRDGHVQDKRNTENVAQHNNALSDFQKDIQSSHPPFQAAKISAWSAEDKSQLVKAMMDMVNDNRCNPYSKVLRTGSASKGIVTDAHNQDCREAIIWTTNLYLGLNRDERVIAAASEALNALGTGMGTSAAASGLTDLHLTFEQEFAQLVGKQQACLFPTGYTANVGAVAGLLSRNDVVIVDQLCHASIVDGAKVSDAKIRSFKHNDIVDLELLLASEASPYRTILVVIEGVYSMGEGAAPVADIVRVAKKYNALILVDEAHSFGFYGENGAGICAQQGVTEQVDFIMTTLSKSLGSLGGVVAAKQEYIDLLKSSARAYIFQASVSPADIAAALASLRTLRSDESIRARLWDTARYMRQQFEAAGYDLGTGDGPIVTPHFSDKDTLYAIVQKLYERGVQASAVTYPIVEHGRGRLRFICSAAHNREDVDNTLLALKAAEQDVLCENECLPTAHEEHITSVDISTWFERFYERLQTTVSGQSAPSPELTCEIAVAGSTARFTVTYQSGKLAKIAPQGGALPSCLLVLYSSKAESALCRQDLAALMHCICLGECELSGDSEVFVWLTARLAECL